MNLFIPISVGFRYYEQLLREQNYYVMCVTICENIKMP